MNPAAKYVTHTLFGPIPHLPCISNVGPFEAPVKLVTKERNLVTGHMGKNKIPAGMPMIRAHCFVHALPGGQEILGEQIGYFEEQRLIKRQQDVMEFWNAQPHYTGD